MAAKALIMAGGEGVRLRPMTLLTPKPLMPLLEKPVMDYALTLLRRHGIREAGVTVCYRAADIEQTFGNGSRLGMKLRYFTETVPQGTAGCVRAARDRLRGTLIVLSGDGLTDCDLTDALAFHRKKGALATLVLKKVEIPLSYGVVMTDADGRVTRFIEKPTWHSVFSDLVNTGIYILEPDIFRFIPESGAADFAKDVFPALLRAGQPVFGYEMDGYWCDIGSQEALMEAQQDLLQGKVALPHPSGVDRAAQVHPDAVLSGCCYVGPGAQVEAGARLTDTALFSGARAGARSVLTRSCLWENAAVGEDAFLEGALLCRGAVARRGAVLSRNCALGQEADAGEDCTLLPGVKVAPFLKIPEGMFVHEDVTAPLPVALSSEGLDLSAPQDACRLAAAAAEHFSARKIVLGTDETGGAIGDLLSGALCARGLQVIRIFTPSLPQLQLMTAAYGGEGGLFASGRHVTVTDGQGDLLQGRALSAMNARLTRWEQPPAFVFGGGAFSPGGSDSAYLTAVAPGDVPPASLSAHFRVFCGNKALLRLCGRALLSAGARYVSMSGLDDMNLREGETGFLLHEDGRNVLPFTAACTPSAEQNTLLKLWLSMHYAHGALYSTDPGLPRSAEQMARFLPLCEAADCQRQKLLLRDGIALCAHLAPVLNETPLEALLEKLPETHILETRLPCRDADKGRVLRALSDTLLPHTLDDGLRITHPRGSAAIVPDAGAGGIRIRSESRDVEFARELCDFYQRKAEAVIQKAQKS